MNAALGMIITKGSNEDKYFSKLSLLENISRHKLHVNVDHNLKRNSHCL